MNRGMAYTMDALVAITVVLGLLGAASYYTLKHESAEVLDYEMMDSGYRITEASTYYACAPGRTWIEEDRIPSGLLSNITLPGYEMKLRITRYRHNGDGFVVTDQKTVGREIRNDAETVVYGERKYAVPANEGDEQTYCTGEFWVWR